MQALQFVPPEEQHKLQKIIQDVEMKYAYYYQINIKIDCEIEMIILYA